MESRVEVLGQDVEEESVKGECRGKEGEKGGMTEECR